MSPTNVKEALALHEKQYEEHRDDPTLGPFHPTTMQSQLNYLNAKFYAVFNGGLGNVEEAIEYFDECFQLKKKLKMATTAARKTDSNWPPEAYSPPAGDELSDEEEEEVHRARMSVFRAIHSTKCGKIDQARLLYNNVFLIMERILGPEHPETLHAYRMSKLLDEEASEDEEEESDDDDWDEDDWEGGNSNVRPSSVKTRMMEKEMGRTPSEIQNWRAVMNEIRSDTRFIKRRTQTRGNDSEKDDLREHSPDLNSYRDGRSNMESRKVQTNSSHRDGIESQLKSHVNSMSGQVRNAEHQQQKEIQQPRTLNSDIKDMKVKNVDLSSSAILQKHVCKDFDQETPVEKRKVEFREKDRKEGCEEDERPEKRICCTIT